ncbi:ester cyclase [Nocardia sp. NBC_01388]|uniref:ester cyclase n=1 Tax=Nocardia sp. NBC_01388 TaxID=2903596 RepID=UPI003869AE9F
MHRTYRLSPKRPIESGEWVAHRFPVRGTHIGDFLGLPPTGPPFETVGMDMIRVRDGRLAEHRMLAEPFRSADRATSGKTAAADQSDSVRHPPAPDRPLPCDIDRARCRIHV